MLESPAESKAELSHLLQYHGSLDYARQRAQGYVARALDVLNGVPEGPAKEALVDVARFMVDRTT
jgi:octaprenyl-diphosphate synthase